VLFSRSQTSLAIKVLPIQQTLIAIPSTVLLFLGFDSGVLSILLGLVFSLGYLGGLIFVLRIIDNRKYGLPSLNIFALGNLKESIYLWQLGLSGSLYDRAVLIFVEHLRPEFLAVYIILNQILQGISGVLVQIQKVLIPKIRSYFEDANTNKINKILTLHTTFYLVAMTILLSFGINIGNVFPEIYSLEIALYASLILSEWLCRALTTTCISALLVYRLEKYIRNMLVSIQVIFGVVQMMMAYFLTSLVAILLLRVIVGGVIIILFYKRLKIFALSLLSIVLVIWIPLAVYVSQSGIGQDSTTTLTFITLLLLVLIGSVAIAQVKQKRACEGASQE
jgi:O-antigen/teichoic acid export membrane protein